MVTRRLVDMAEELRSPLVVLHPPDTDECNDARSLSSVDALTMEQRTLGATPVLLALENPAPLLHGQHPLADPVALRAFARAYDLSLVLDTAHAASLAQSLEQTYRCYDGQLANVHLSDVSESCLLPDIFGVHSFLKRHQFPGEGTLPLVGFLRQLAIDGYQGPITLELSPVALRVWWPPAAERRLRDEG